MQSASNSTTETYTPQRFTLSQWQLERSAHHKVLNPWVADRLHRANFDVPHPVFDFLFTYYSFPPARLMRWSPGVDGVVEASKLAMLDWSDYFEQHAEGYVLSPAFFPSHRRGYLNWAIRYLTETGERAPFFGCFGLHEWAMLYQTPHPRHTGVPLRVSNKEISAVVDDMQPRCTHYDAFRFFTPAARPLNRQQLTRITTAEHDQPACIHVTMDLYRFAYKIAPFCPSAVIQESFLLAAQARTIDMQASPYDLSEFDLDPIRIETQAGRERYIAKQRELVERSSPLRKKLLKIYLYLASR